MPAEILWAGGSPASWIVTGGSISASTNTNHFDATYSKCATSFANTAYARTPDFATSGSGKLYFKQRIYIDGTSLLSGTNSFIEFTDNLDRALARIAVVSAALRAEGNTGSAASPTWTAAPSGYTVSGQSTIVLDVELTIGSPNVLKLFINNTEVSAVTFTQAATNTIARVKFRGVTFGAGTFMQLSEGVLTRDLSTIGKRLYTALATANGALAQWTGSYTDIDEVGQDDNDFITATSAGLVSTFSHGSLPALAGSVVGVVAEARAKSDLASPQNMALLLRVGSTNYESGTKALSSGYQPLQHSWLLNPANSQAWTFATAASEFGVKAIA